MNVYILNMLDRQWNEICKLYFDGINKDLRQVTVHISGETYFTVQI
jgi:hypothetical protein